MEKLSKQVMMGQGLEPWERAAMELSFRMNANPRVAQTVPLVQPQIDRLPLDSSNHQGAAKIRAKILFDEYNHDNQL